MEKLIINDINVAIIEYLIINLDYCDSYDIARNVGINRRQVRSAIISIKDILRDLGFTLESKRSKGYRIVERNRINELSDTFNSMRFRNRTQVFQAEPYRCPLDILR